MAGVSTATVSRVLNDIPTVDAKLARRVRTAITKLGYEPSRVARSLRVKRSRVWALVIPELRNPFFTDMISGVEEVARAAGFMLFLCNADSDVDKEASYLRLAVAEHVAGIILSPASQAASARALGTLGTTPVVTVDRRLDAPVDWVGVNNRQGAEMAVHHLADNGYRRIACISGPGDTSTGAARLAGYRRARGARGTDGGPDLVRVGDFDENHGFRAMGQLLRLRPPPDAVFATNNLISLGALRAIDEAGARVPEDIAIVGFDDMPWTSLVKTPLTAVAQPTYDIGRETARLLMSRVEGDAAPPREIMLSPTLVVRGSSSARRSALSQRQR